MRRIVWFIPVIAILIGMTIFNNTDKVVYLLNKPVITRTKTPTKTAKPIPKTKTPLPTKTKTRPPPTKTPKPTATPTNVQPVDPTTYLFAGTWIYGDETSTTQVGAYYEFTFTGWGYAMYLPDIPPASFDDCSMFDVYDNGQHVSRICESEGGLLIEENYDRKKEHVIKIRLVRGTLTVGRNIYCRNEVCTNFWSPS